MLVELRKLAEQDHYMEVSEEIRSILRKNWFKYTHPELLEIQRLRKDILSEVSKSRQQEVKKQVIRELDDIKKIVKKQENDII